MKTRKLIILLITASLFMSSSSNKSEHKYTGSKYSVLVSTNFLSEKHYNAYKEFENGVLNIETWHKIEQNWITHYADLTLTQIDEINVSELTIKNDTITVFSLAPEYSKEIKSKLIKGLQENRVYFASAILGDEYGTLITITPSKEDIGNTENDSLYPIIYLFSSDLAANYSKEVFEALDSKK